jgi:hypothetical protein
VNGSPETGHKPCRMSPFLVDTPWCRDAAGLNVVRPTRGLLGYVPRTSVISNEIRNIYAELGVRANYDAENQDLANIEFGRNVNGIPFCIDLLRHVSVKIQESRMPLVIGPIESQVGSQTQLGYVRADDAHFGQSRPTQGIVVARSYTQLIFLRAYAIAVLKPRVQYSNLPGNFIYRFFGNEVPNTWVATRNAQFEFGHPEWINHDTFGLADVDGRAVVNEYVKTLYARSRHQWIRSWTVIIEGKLKRTPSETQNRVVELPHWTGKSWCDRIPSASVSFFDQQIDWLIDWFLFISCLVHKTQGPFSVDENLHRTKQYKKIAYNINN